MCICSAFALQMDPEAFWLEFVRLLKYPMIVYAREPVVERTMEFVAKFVCSVSNASEEDSDDNSLLNKLVTFLLQVCDKLQGFNYLFKKTVLGNRIVQSKTGGLVTLLKQVIAKKS